MKILHVINNLKGGGAERLIEQLVPRMNEKEHIQADVLLLTDRGNVFGKSLVDKDVNLFVIPLQSSRNPLNVFYIRRLIVRGRYDVVHAHLFPTLYWVSIASRLVSNKNRPRLFFTEHSTHNRRREKGFLRPIERIVYSSYDGVIAVSDIARKNLVEWLGLENDDKFVTISNGINLNHFKEAFPYEKQQISSSFTEKTTLICMVGRFSKVKDQKTVIHSLKYLPEHIQLILVGDGELREEHEGLANELNLGSRVHFLGFRDDVERILKTADIVILSSHWEGSPLSAIEGMAAGKPVIGSNVHGICEVVGDYGILFEEGNSKKLAEIVMGLVNDNDWYHQIADSCSVRANSFDIVRMIDNYFRVYE